jgi:hypothetical protein
VTSQSTIGGCAGIGRTRECPITIHIWLVLPDRIELFRRGTRSLKNREFFEPLASVVYQREDHL